MQRLLTSLSRVTMTGGTSCHHLTTSDDDDWNDNFNQNDDDGEDGVDQHIHFLNQCYAMKGNMTHTVT